MSEALSEDDDPFDGMQSAGWRRSKCGRAQGKRAAPNEGVSAEMWDPTSTVNWYRLIRDWGLIGGGLALAAGYWAYRAGQIQANATRKAAKDQLAANAKKDRLQAQAMARAIFTEIIEVTVHIDRVRGLMEQSREKYPRQLTYQTKIEDFSEQIAGLIREAKIP